MNPGTPEPGYFVGKSGGVPPLLLLLGLSSVSSSSVSWPGYVAGGCGAKAGKKGVLLSAGHMHGSAAFLLKPGVAGVVHSCFITFLHPKK